MNFKAVLLVAGALALVATSAVAATTVTIKLTDRGVETGSMSQAIQLSRASAPKGDITFKVSNTSKDLVHEMLVVRLPAPGFELPMKADGSGFDEDAIKSLGEVSELDPGKAGTLTVSLKPGSYLLVCNVPGHFEAGMSAVFTVTG